MSPSIPRSVLLAAAFVLVTTGCVEEPDILLRISRDDRTVNLDVKTCAPMAARCTPETSRVFGPNDDLESRVDVFIDTQYTEPTIALEFTLNNQAMAVCNRVEIQTDVLPLEISAEIPASSIELTLSCTGESCTEPVDCSVQL